MNPKQIELHLQEVDFHLQHDAPAKFTFSGYIYPFESGDQVLQWMKSNPKNCQLKFFIKLPDDSHAN